MIDQLIDVVKFHKSDYPEYKPAWYTGAFTDRHAATFIFGHAGKGGSADSDSDRNHGLTELFLCVEASLLNTILGTGFVAKSRPNVAVEMSMKGALAGYARFFFLVLLP